MARKRKVMRKIKFNETENKILKELYDVSFPVNITHLVSILKLKTKPYSALNRLIDKRFINKSKRGNMNLYEITDKGKEQIKYIYSKEYYINLNKENKEALNRLSDKIGKIKDTTLHLRFLIEINELYKNADLYTPDYLKREINKLSKKLETKL